MQWKVLSSTTFVKINRDIDLSSFSGISIGIKVFSKNGNISKVLFNFTMNEKV